MSTSYNYLPIHALRSVKSSFPKKGSAPPMIPIAAGEAADDSFDPTVYLLNVQVDSTGSKVAVSTSNCDVKIYSTDDLNLLSQLTGHTGPITDIKFSDSDVHTLVSSSDDGTISIWDTRNGKRVTSQSGNKIMYKSVAVAGNTLASGTADGLVAFWDLRHMDQPCQLLEDYFSEDVTQLAFHPTAKTHLCAGSYDGLICQIDTAVPLSSEEAVLDVLNIGTAVSRMGIFGPSAEYLYTLAPTEQLQIFSESTKVADSGFGLRETLSALCGEEINYIIDCKYDAARGMLLIFAGSFTGPIFVFSCESNNTYHFLAKLTGHSAVVRDIWLHPSGESAFSVGEDSIITSWAAHAGSSAPSKTHTAEASFSVSQRNKPY